MRIQRCSICKEDFPDDEFYEYRGAVACEKDFEAAIQKRDREREEIIFRQEAEQRPFAGLDFGDNAIGRTNRRILGDRLTQYKRAVGGRDY